MKDIRSKALDSFSIWHSAAEEEYDELVCLLPELLSVPLAGLSFLHDDTVWYKSSVGIEPQEFSAKLSPITKAVISDDVFTVSLDDDTGKGANWFKGTPLESVKFYAAFPIKPEDSPVIGALEIMDYQERSLTGLEAKILRVFGKNIVNILELRREQKITGDFSAGEALHITSALPYEIKAIQKLINRLPDIICIKDRNGRYLMDNEAHRSFLGIKKSRNIIGKKVSDFLPEEIAKAHQESDNEVVKSGHPLISESAPVIDPLGRKTTVSSSRIPLHDDKGDIEGILCIERENPQHSSVEESLAQERYLLNSFMRNINDNIYFKNRESRFIRINTACAKWFGLNSPEEAVGRTDFDFFTREHAQQAYEDEQRVMETGEPIIGKEEKETWPDGRATWVSTTKEPLKDQNGSVIGCFGISRDITHTKSISLELAERDQSVREEMKLARSIHDAMLPTGMPEVEGMEFGLRFVPSGDIGGDFLDFIHLDKDSQIGIVFADITGHGIAAALLSAMLKVLVDEITPICHNQSECFMTLNQRLHNAYPPGNFASTFYAVIDARERSINYVKASQEPVILIREGEKPQILTDGGPALGLLDSDLLNKNDYPQHTVELKKGDTIFFFTDGLLEYIKPSQTVAVPLNVLMQWLEELSCLSPQALVDQVYERATAYADVSSPTDDAAALAVKIVN